MKSLVVYYSRTNTTKKIAEELVRHFEADEERLIDLKKRDGAIGYITGGKDAMQEKTTDIQEPKHKPDSYDMVFIGTPVWVGKMAPAVRTYLKDNLGKFRNVAFFVTQGAIPPKQDNIFLRLEEICGQKSRACLHLSTKQVLKDGYKKELEQFIDNLKAPSA